MGKSSGEGGKGEEILKGTGIIDKGRVDGYVVKGRDVERVGWSKWMEMDWCGGGSGWRWTGVVVVEVDGDRLVWWLREWMEIDWCGGGGSGWR
ncbi:hypothetical protein Pcinc_026871 [Petrolisthes cinctipes]|uniref:Uncharacterized protein n=1 Tax=Petrolisthes cinctipes TaxID=88211 RepID=A0AAE1F573_PETCI|nr:hypothetical protein Pcinc_026871 [Petrolisthes cinctipes]